jgi:hypothetical protein
MLLIEVLRRAAHDWVLYRASTRLLQKQIADEAYQWLFKEVPGSRAWVERALCGKQLTSFTCICEILSLDPEAVRTYVRGLTIKEILSTGRPPTYRRQKDRKRKSLVAVQEPIVKVPEIVVRKLPLALPPPMVVYHPRLLHIVSPYISALMQKAADTSANVLLQANG